VNNNTIKPDLAASKKSNFSLSIYSYFSLPLEYEQVSRTADQVRVVHLKH